eukprot:gene35320-45736_t
MVELYLCFMGIKHWNRRFGALLGWMASIIMHSKPLAYLTLAFVLTPPSTTPPGTLQLDLSWSPLDNTVATAAGARVLRGRPLRDSSSFLELVARGIEGELIDHSFVGGTVTVKLDYGPADAVSITAFDACAGGGDAADRSEQEQVVADLLHFRGRDLKEAGCSVVGLGLCIVWGIDKLHHVRPVLRSDDDEEDNAATISIPHGSFDLMVLLMMQSRVIIHEEGNRQPVRREVSELRCVASFRGICRAYGGSTVRPSQNSRVMRTILNAGNEINELKTSTAKTAVQQYIVTRSPISKRSR